MFTAFALFFLFLSEPVKITLPLKVPVKAKAEFVFLSVIFPGEKKKAAGNKKRKRAEKPRKAREKKENVALALLSAFSYLRKKIDVTLFLPRDLKNALFHIPDNNLWQSACHDAEKSVLFGSLALLFHSFVPVNRPFYDGCSAPVIVVDSTVFHLFAALTVFVFSSIGRKIQKVFG